jgi:hypothetical protein
MQKLYLDIETLPGDPPDPGQIEPPKNYKDPEKIHAYQREKAEEAHRAQAVDSMRGRLLCIGWALGSECSRAAIVGKDGISTERELLQVFQASLLERPGDLESIIWVGHNIRTFDLPWLWRKALQYRLYPLAGIIPRQRYDKRVQDTMEMWAADFRDRVSLDAIAAFLGLQGKPEGIDGSKVYDYWLAGDLDSIKEYCRQDIELVYTVHTIITAGVGDRYPAAPERISAL